MYAKAPFRFDMEMEFLGAEGGGDPGIQEDANCISYPNCGVDAPAYLHALYSYHSCTPSSADQCSPVYK